MKWLVIWYVLASFAAFLAFAVDKSRARRGAWRTPERTLHAFSMVGGFAGAFAAMVFLRHKNRKPAFWFMTAAAACVHVALLVFLLR